MMDILFHVCATLALGFVATIWSGTGALNIFCKFSLAVITLLGAVIIASDLMKMGVLS